MRCPQASILHPLIFCSRPHALCSGTLLPCRQLTARPPGSRSLSGTASTTLGQAAAHEPTLAPGTAASSSPTPASAASLLGASADTSSPAAAAPAASRSLAGSPTCQHSAAEASAPAELSSRAEEMHPAPMPKTSREQPAAQPSAASAAAMLDSAWWHLQLWADVAVHRTRAAPGLQPAGTAADGGSLLRERAPSSY